jgi:predicted HTH domain antitoxin
MSFVVEIPDSVAEGLRLPEGEVQSRLRCELAAALYRQEILAFGKAAELAGLAREAFAVELARRNIHRHYSQEDASFDEAYARR